MFEVRSETDSVRSLSVQGLPPIYSDRLESRKAIILSEDFFLACGNHRVKAVNEIYYCTRCGKEVCRVLIKPDPKVYFTKGCYCGSCQKEINYGYIGVIPTRLTSQESQEIPFEYIVAEFLLNSEAHV